MAEFSNCPWSGGHLPFAGPWRMWFPAYKQSCWPWALDLLQKIRTFTNSHYWPLCFKHFTCTPLFSSAERLRYLAQSLQGAEPGFELRKSGSESALSHPVPAGGALHAVCGAAPTSDHVNPGAVASPNSFLCPQHLMTCLTHSCPIGVLCEGICSGMSCSKRDF